VPGESVCLGSRPTRPFLTPARSVFRVVLLRNPTDPSCSNADHRGCSAKAILVGKHLIRLPPKGSHGAVRARQ